METVLPAWDAASYAANRGHHQAHDEAFLATLPLRPSDDKSQSDQHVATSAALFPWVKRTP